MIATQQIKCAEILSVARQFSLTEHETQIAAKFLAGEKMPFTLQNYPREIRTFVAFIREKRIQEKEYKNPFAKLS